VPFGVLGVFGVLETYATILNSLERLHRFASRLGLTYGFPCWSYGTARVFLEALCLDDGERLPAEMSNLR
jgi:hypothetical protein